MMSAQMKMMSKVQIMVLCMEKAMKRENVKVCNDVIREMSDMAVYPKLPYLTDIEECTLDGDFDFGYITQYLKSNGVGQMQIHFCPICGDYTIHGDTTLEDEPKKIDCMCYY